MAKKYKKIRKSKEERDAWDAHVDETLRRLREVAERMLGTRSAKARSRAKQARAPRRRAPARPRGSRRRASPRASRASSPVAASSCTMSAPPTSSPPMKTCGIVGQPESVGQLLPDAGVGEDVDGSDGRAGAPQRLQRALRVAAHHELRSPLHEQSHRLRLDHGLDPVRAARRSCGSFRLDPHLVNPA